MTGTFPIDRPSRLLRRRTFPQAALAAKLYDASVRTVLERAGTFCSERQDIDHVALLESGMCMASKHLRDGQRLNVAIYVPGDILGHEVLTLGTTTSTIVALTPATYYRLPRAHLREALARNDDLAQAFLHYVAFQGALGHEWMLSLGRRPAFERMAHFLCELVCRMHAVGEGAKIECGFPLNQTELADILGLSVVHVNRTLQSLRQGGYVALQRGRLDVLDWGRLAALAHFDTSYLDLAAEA